jgi:xanthine dehydrogenase YagS FAD-binding subunit
MNRFEWMNAQTVLQAAEAATTTVADAMIRRSGESLTEGVVLFKAGGIDLLYLMKENLVMPRRLVNLRGAAGLDDIVEEKNGALRIGSLVTLARLAENPIVRQRYTALAEAAGASASPQIRHVATLGGNLLQRPRCWYFRSLHHHCARKGANRASPLAARTNTMQSSINRGAPSFTPRPQRPPWWRLAPGSNW